MIEVVPAVMADSFDDMREKIARVKDLIPMVQIDVMDGIFVPDRSWPYVSGGPQEFAEYVNEKEGFPFWDKVNFEADLMVKNPEAAVEDWVHAGASRVIVHIESVPNMTDFLNHVRDMLSKDETDIVGVEFGLAINTTTDNELLLPHIEHINVLQCMGIERIGFQGEPFDERVLDKIAFFRKERPDLTISVDGGVSLETAPKLIEAGANILVSGSAVFGSDDIVGTIEALRGE